MSIPKDKEMVIPLIKFLSDGKPHFPSEAYNYIADFFGLTEIEKKARYRKTKDIIYKNRTRFARNEIRKMGFLKNQRGIWQFNAKGLEKAKIIISSANFNI